MIGEFKFTLNERTPQVERFASLCVCVFKRVAGEMDLVHNELQAQRLQGTSRLEARPSEIVRTVHLLYAAH